MADEKKDAPKAAPTATAAKSDGGEKKYDGFGREVDVATGALKTDDEGNVVKKEEKKD